MYEKTLFIFRRDLRLFDNLGLQYALSESKVVIPSFIFTPEQIEKNSYRSDHCLQFMIESLEDLEDQLKEKKAKLYLFYNSPEKVVEKLIQTEKIDCVVVNRDYTPYAIKRDKKLGSICKKNKVTFVTVNDTLLHAPEETLKSNGKPYTIFTPYFRNASKLKVEPPQKTAQNNFYKQEIDFAKNSSLYKKILPKREPKPIFKGGRSEGLKILKKIAGDRKSVV